MRCLEGQTAQHLKKFHEHDDSPQPLIQNTCPRGHECLCTHNKS